MNRKFLVFFAVAGLLFSCAPFSKEIRRQVDESLAFREMQRDPQPYLGKTVIWGGVIIEAKNRKDATLLQIIQTELDYEKRPKHLDHSAGRFLVRYKGFLDPAIFKEGREITVAGEFIGKEVLPLGETQYSYPVLLPKEIHLWPKRQEFHPIDPWYTGPYPYYWWPRYPYWRYGPYW